MIATPIGAVSRATACRPVDAARRSNRDAARSPSHDLIARPRTFEVLDFGTRIQYPAGIFSPAGKPEKGLGQRFERADGRAVLSIYSRPNEAGENPKTYLRNNLRVDRSALDYVRIARSFFAISSERDGVILYSRCNFSGGARGVIHCFDLKYPQQEKRAWDAVVTRISLSLRPLEG